MTDLMIIFGSQSRLLEMLLDRGDTHFLRIFNKNVPPPRENCTDVNSEDAFIDAVENMGKADAYQKIIFIGAAFKTQTSLFVHEKFENVLESIDTNIVQYVRYANLLLPHMIKKKNGTFIYLSSFRSQETSRGVSLYAASKAFGEKFFEVLGKEYGRMGITSTSIRMGYFEGRMTDFIDEDKKKKLTLSIGTGRLGSSTDLVRAIEFVISNPYANGGCIDLTGGINFE